MDMAADLLFDLRRKGIRVWLDNSKLRYQTNGRALAPAELDELRASKTILVRYLQEHQYSPDGEVPKPPPHPFQHRAPLAFSQQWLWNLEDWRSVRYLGLLTEIRGDLNIERFRKSITLLTLRHRVLQSTVVTHDDHQWQEFGQTNVPQIDVISLIETPKEKQPTVIKQIIFKLFSQRVDRTIGPLFETKLLKLDDRNYLFAVAVDHLVCDAPSRGILLRDMWATYDQLSGGKASFLSDIPTQFSDYSVWQHSASASWARDHGDYWTRRLAGAQRFRVFADEGESDIKPANWANWETKFPRSLCARLVLLSQKERTTVAMCVLTAYAALLLRWCKTHDLVIRFTTSGRSRPEIQNSVGYFVYPLFLRIEQFHADTFLDLLRRVTTEHARANEHCDYGRIASQSPRPEFTRNPFVNWIPPGFGVAVTGEFDHSQVDGLGGLRLRPYKLEYTSEDRESMAGKEEAPSIAQDEEPWVSFFESEESITGYFSCMGHAVKDDSVERFKRNFNVFVETLAHRPNTYIEKAPLLQ